MRSIASLTTGKTNKTTIAIEAGTLSERFDLPGMRVGAVISTTGSSRTLTLQIWNEIDEDWVDTPLTKTTSASDGTVWLADDLSPYSAGYSGHGLFRLKLSGSDTVSVVFYAN